MISIRISQRRGFTLIEMLVTLVLVALITTTIMQGMSYIWRLQTRSNRVIATATVADMHAAWWREAIRGLVTVPPQKVGLFKGTQHQLQGLSLYVPGRVPDIVASLACRIASHARVDTLTCNNQPILQLPAGSYFYYLDTHRQRQQTWPPSTGSYRQLPQTILIGNNDAVVWAASPLQPSAPQFVQYQYAQGDLAP